MSTVMNIPANRITLEISSETQWGFGFIDSCSDRVRDRKTVSIEGSEYMVEKVWKRRKIPNAWVIVLVHVGG